MRDPVKGKSAAGRAREERARATRQRIVDAAVELFLERGYVATSITAIAERAGVAPATIYQAFATKQAVLERALDVVIAGDDLPVAVVERTWVDAARRERNALRRLTLVVRETTTIAARAAALRDVLRDGAAVEPALRGVIREGHRRRRESFAVLVDVLAGDHSLRAGLSRARAADVLFALVNSENYQLLVETLGWTLSTWQDWLVETLSRELFGDSPSTKRTTTVHRQRGST